MHALCGRALASPVTSRHVDETTEVGETIIARRDRVSFGRYTGNVPCRCAWLFGSRFDRNKRCSLSMARVYMIVL